MFCTRLYKLLFFFVSRLVRCSIRPFLVNKSILERSFLNCHCLYKSYFSVPKLISMGICFFISFCTRLYGNFMYPYTVTEIEDFRKKTNFSLFYVNFLVACTRLYIPLCPSVGPSRLAFVNFFTAPAHPHATKGAVYPALFLKAGGCTEGS